MTEWEHRAARDGAVGADRMAAGLSCIPDKRRGDLDEVLRLRAEIEQLRAALQAVVDCEERYGLQAFDIERGGYEIAEAVRLAMAALGENR